MRLIDITPQWQGVWRLLAEAAVRGRGAGARSKATAELDRMATLADAYGEAVKMAQSGTAGLLLRDALREAYDIAVAGGTRRPDIITDEEV